MNSGSALQPGAATMDIVSGQDQTGAPSKQLPAPLVVRVTDSNGSPVGGQIVNFRVTSGGGRVYAGTALTNGSGLAQEWWTLGPELGMNTLEVRAVDSGSGEKRVFATFQAEARTPAAQISVSPGSASLAPGEKVQLTATVTDANGNTLSGRSVAWSSSNSAVATVTSTGSTTAEVTGVGAGSATITATSEGAGAEASITVSNPVLFVDDFETGDLSNSQNGFRWARADQAPSDPGTGFYIGVVSDFARTGSSSLLMQAPAVADGKQTWLEQRFWFPKQSEMWIEYYIHIPSNYYHRTTTDPANNKFLLLWGGGDAGYTQSDKAKVGAEFWPTGTTGDSQWRFLYDLDGQVDTRTLAWVDPAISASGPMLRGKWNRFRCHFKMASGPGAADGLFRCWVGDAVVIDRSDVQMYPTTPNHPYFDTGYLLGYSNSGYSELTKFYIDDFKIYASNPGW